MSAYPHFVESEHPFSAVRARVTEIGSRATNFFKELQPKPRRVKSKHTSWSATNQVEWRFATLPYNTKESREKALRMDAEHFSSEFSLRQPIRQFEYILNRKTEKAESGGYSEPFAVLLSNFVQILKDEHCPQSRALIEQMTIQQTFAAFRQLVNQAEEANQLDQLTEQGVLITSPPDTKSAGYSGIDSLCNWSAPEHNQTFCYLMQVSNYTEQTITVTVKQYLLWPNLQQLLDLHKTLGKPLQPSPKNITCELYANAIPLTLSQLEALAPTTESAPPDPSENPLQHLLCKILYQNSNQHAHSFREQPLVDEEAFWQYHQDLFENFYLKLAHPLFDQAVELYQKSGNNTREYRTVIEQLDQLFTWFQTTEASWVATHNTNPLFRQNAFDSTSVSLQHAFNRMIQSFNE